MSQENVISVRLEDPARAGDALDALTEASKAGKLRLNAAVTVAVAQDGSVTVGDLRETPGDGMQRSGSLGGLVGILGGPIGMIVGWGIGTRLGEKVDAEEAEADEDAIVAAVHGLPAGTTALVAEVEEEVANEPLLDGLMADLGGTVHRRSTEVLLDDLEAYVAGGEVPPADEHAERAGRGERIEALRVRIEGGRG